MASGFSAQNFPRVFYRKCQFLCGFPQWALSLSLSSDVRIPLTSPPSPLCSLPTPARGLLPSPARLSYLPPSISSKWSLLPRYRPSIPSASGYSDFGQLAPRPCGGHPRNRWSGTSKPSVLGREFHLQQHSGKPHKDKLSGHQGQCEPGYIPLAGMKSERARHVGEMFVIQEAAHDPREDPSVARLEICLSHRTSSESSVTVKHDPIDRRVTWLLSRARVKIATTLKSLLFIFDAGTDPGLHACSAHVLTPSPNAVSCQHSNKYSTSKDKRFIIMTWTFEGWSPWQVGTEAQSLWQDSRSWQEFLAEQDCKAAHGQETERGRDRSPTIPFKGRAP